MKTWAGCLPQTEEEIQALVEQMPLTERIAWMSGCCDVERIREIWRQNGNYSYWPYCVQGSADLPALAFSDGPRGVVCGVGRSTCFPTPVCRGAAFDVAMEEQIGAAMGRELRAYGANLSGAVCVNLPYFPGWGRRQEVYGEDSFALGQLGAALVRGLRSEYVMACVKHFAFNSMETDRCQVNVYCNVRTEREVFLPHFKDCIDAGADCVMAAFNSYQGQHCAENEYLLGRILKQEWGFRGFVISDFYWALRDTEAAAQAGLDIEMPRPRLYGERLLQAVERGEIPEYVVNEAVQRILRTLLANERDYAASGLRAAPRVIGCKAHRQLALQAARRGMTLLKNENQILPFRRRGVKKLLVLGALASKDCTGDHGSSRVFPAHCVTILEGLAQFLPKTEIVYSDGSNRMHSKRLAAEADAVIVVAGTGYEEEGEYSATRYGAERSQQISGDRPTLALPEAEMIRSVGSINPYTAVVLLGGGMHCMEDWIDAVPAVLMAYYPGQEGGTAVAETLFGRNNPGGKLPFVVARREEDLPRPDPDRMVQEYGYYHGYRKLEKEHIRPLFPYGFGLSYTQFTLTEPHFWREGQTLGASCVVHNVGKTAGDEVVQFYIGFEHSRLDRPHKTLCGFQRVTLQPGESKIVRLCCPPERMCYYDEQSRSFRQESMEYEVYIGTSSDEADLFCGSVLLEV